MQVVPALSIAALSLVVVGCQATVGGVAQAPPMETGVAASTCTPGSGHITFPGQRNAEQSVHVPVVANWSPVVLERSPHLYPQDIGIVVNQQHRGHRGNGRGHRHTATLIVSVDRVGGRSDADYARVLPATLAAAAARTTSEEILICGRVGYLTDFSGMAAGTAPATDGTAITVIEDSPAGDRYAYIAVLQTTDTASPDWAAARDSLLAGFTIGD
jgi:hypothetical protein